LVSDTRGQTHDSSPLLHTQFRSPAESVSADSHRPDSAQTDAPPPENFIDLRESGAYEHIEVPNTQRSAPGFNSYGAHGVPPRTGHGVTPLMQFGKAAPLTQKYGEQPVFRLTPDTEVKAEFPNPTPATAVPAYEQHTMQTTGLTVNGDDSYGEWSLLFHTYALARQLSPVALPWQSLCTATFILALTTPPLASSSSFLLRLSFFFSCSF
jgi:hypothetical protein